DVLSEAVKRVLPAFRFHPSEYLPFENASNFLSLLANAFISCLEQCTDKPIIVLDDLHTLAGDPARRLIAGIMKYSPDGARFFLGSREAPWPGLIPFQLRGSMLEITQWELAFTKEEVEAFIGSRNENIYRITEGWPIAVGSFKLLMESGLPETEFITRGNEVLHAYLFCECTSRLSPELVAFLKSSSCFEELDVHMLDTVLKVKNTKLLLESLIARGIFTIKTEGGSYRYHPLFREYLRGLGDGAEEARIWRSAAEYYFNAGQYAGTAAYAVKVDDKKLLRETILRCYDDYIRNGAFHELRAWFEALGEEAVNYDLELLAAEGALLSCIGNFTEAKISLDKAIPRLDERNKDLYIKAMVHKARVLRNCASFEESNALLDELIPSLDPADAETVYHVAIEKLYNLCWNTQLDEAYALARRMIEACANAGNVRVRAWYERYLSVIHYVAGRMKDSVRCYERSLEISEEDLRQLELHSVEVYAAKAYQMLGQREKAVRLVTDGLERLRSSGHYEELWLGYLFAAEIHYQNTTIDRMNGGGQSYETTIKYFTLADEYTPLYRKAEFHLVWAALQKNIYSLMFAGRDNEKLIGEIYAGIPRVSDHFKTIAYGRLYNYFGSISDFVRAAECARRSIEIGERSNTMMVATMAYGFLARISLAEGDKEKTIALARRFLQLCDINGIYEYFRMRKAYDPILQFAYDNGIETDFVKQMMEFSGCRAKKAYIKMLGDFSVYAYDDRKTSLKLRTRKARELLAFLLDAGERGATKEQIYEALWYESESNDVKKLIGVNLAQIKKDLAALGIADPIQNRGKHYRILMDELATDTAPFEEAVAEFRQRKSAETAKRLLALYGGEYLSSFEAHWAARRRIEYQEAYLEAAEYLAGQNVQND
ncbi:MAG: hypothetical protein AAGU32_01645, partial [Bacillota bacterium]